MRARTACPVCRSEKTTQAVHVVTDHVPMEENLIYRFCDSCGLVFSEFDFDSSELAGIYDGAFRDKDRSEFLKYTQYKIQVSAYRKKWMDRAITRLGWKPYGRRVLEIGPKDGSFLHLLKKDGWSVLGIDPNVAYGRLAKELYGVEFRAGYFDPDSLNGERFDLITAFHVIEHVQNPLGFLAGIRQTIRDDGCLYLETPNLHAMQRRLLHKEHVILFSRHTLGQVLKHTGFQAMEVSECAPGILTFDQLGILARPCSEGQPVVWERCDDIESVRAALGESLRSRFPEPDAPTLKNRVFRWTQSLLGDQAANTLKNLYRKAQQRSAMPVVATADRGMMTKLSDTVRDAFLDGVLSRKHVKELSRLPDEFAQLKVLARIKAHRLSVEETRDLVAKELGA